MAGATGKINFTGDGNSAVRELNKIVSAQQKVIDKLNGVERASKKGEAAASKTNALLSKAGTFAAGYMSVSRAIGAVTRSLQEMHAQAQSGMDATERDLANIGKLIQVSGRRTTAQLIAERNALRTDYGLSPDSATNVIFAAESAGFVSDDDRKVLAEVSRYSRANPETLASSAKTLRTQMGGKEVGSLRQQVNKLYAAGKQSPEMTETLAPIMAIAGPLFKAHGFSDEELHAAVATFAPSASTPRMAGTALAATLRFALEKNVSDKTFSGLIGKITGDKKLFGELRKREGPGVLASAFVDKGNMAEYAKILRDVDAQNALTGTPGSSLGVMGAAFRGSPEAMAGIELAKTREIEKVAQERKGLPLIPTQTSQRKQMAGALVEDNAMERLGRSITKGILQVVEENSSTRVSEGTGALAQEIGARAGGSFVSGFNWKSLSNFVASDYLFYRATGMLTPRNSKTAD